MNRKCSELHIRDPCRSQNGLPSKHTNTWPNHYFFSFQVSLPQRRMNSSTTRCYWAAFGPPLWQAHWNTLESHPKRKYLICRYLLSDLFSWTRFPFAHFPSRQHYLFWKCHRSFNWIFFTIWLCFFSFSGLHTNCLKLFFSLFVEPSY